MKTKLFTIIILALFVTSFVSAQVTEAEKTLRTVRVDTTLGWKSGGVFALNFAQTSLTNWAAGGQNSVAVNGLFSGFANLKKEKFGRGPSSKGTCSTSSM